MRTFLALAVILSAAFATPVVAQFKETTEKGGIRLETGITQKLKVGVIVKAGGKACAGIIATAPIPTDWPEQQVKVVEEDISPYVKNVRYRSLGGTVKQMTVEIPTLPAGEEARAVLTLEITRNRIQPPEDTSVYSIPKKPGKDLTIYLGQSPMIETKNAKIMSKAHEVFGDQDSAWERVEGIYDWVREHVAYKHGDLKGALRALNDKEGDCEELTSLFIALCRVNGIPARTVWVPDHCYPEFYLVDSEGKGHWFPCQAAGTRSFGGIPEDRAILQKGDNFKDPERPRERQRYVSGFLKGVGGSPSVTFLPK